MSLPATKMTVPNLLRPFEVRVDRWRDNQVVLEVWQQPLNGSGPLGNPAHRVARLRGLPLHLTWDHLHSLLRRAGARPDFLSPARRERRARLPEEVGVRLALLVAAVAPLRKLERIERIAAALTEMSYEEACYWYAHVRADEGRRALRALRLLLAEE